MMVVSGTSPTLMDSSRRLLFFLSPLKYYFTAETPYLMNLIEYWTNTVVIMNICLYFWPWRRAFLCTDDSDDVLQQLFVAESNLGPDA